MTGALRSMNELLLLLTADMETPPTFPHEIRAFYLKKVRLFIGDSPNHPTMDASLEQGTHS
jgi:hypothetical protein